MRFADIPWLELTIFVPLLGALIVGRLRDPLRDFQYGVGFTAAALLSSLAAYAEFAWATPSNVDTGWNPQQELLGREVFELDRLSAPLFVVVALMHFLVAVSTARTKMRRFSFTWSLATESLRLATFSCSAKYPWLMIGLLIAGTVPPYFVLVNRGRSTRMYVLHIGLFVALLVGGWSLIEAVGGRREGAGWATLPLLLAVLVHLGTVPVHCWVTDWLENASFGNGLLYVIPLPGVFVTIRLVLPLAPDWVLRSIGLISLITAIYAASLATIQRDTRRFFAFIFLSHASSVMIGLELHTAVSLTGSLCLWGSVILSLLGFGLVLRALEARFGRLSLTKYHGLYDHSPTLAVSFLLTGLGCVGFPGTFGYIASELLVDGAVGASLYVGLAVVAASTLNGIAILRAYFLVFTGTRHVSTVALDVGPRERYAILSLVLMILAAGLFPQTITEARHHAAEEILADRFAHVPEESPPPAPIDVDNFDF